MYKYAELIFTTNETYCDLTALWWILKNKMGDSDLRLLIILCVSVALAIPWSPWALASRATLVIKCAWENRRRCRRKTSFICNCYSRLCLQSNRCFKGKSEKQKKVSFNPLVCCLYAISSWCWHGVYTITSVTAVVIEFVMSLHFISVSCFKFVVESANTFFLNLLIQKHELY